MLVALSSLISPIESGKTKGSVPDRVTREGLLARFRRISDHRSTRNVRHPLASILALAACGVAVAGGDSIIAVWHWASDACPQEVPAELEVWRDPLTGLHVPPGERTFRRVLGEVDGDELEREVCAYLAGRAPREADAPGHPDTPGTARPDTAEPAEPAWPNEREARRVRQRDREPPAMAGLPPGAAADGKAIRGARRPDGRRPQLLSPFCHTRDTRLAQRAIDTKTSEVPELKPLIAGVDLAGTVLTADALHTVHETARHLAEDLGAYYVLILKHNQPALLATAMATPADGTDAEHEWAGTGHTEIDRGHGRGERRTIRTAPPTASTFPARSRSCGSCGTSPIGTARAGVKRWPTPSRTCPPTWPDPPIWAPTSAGTGGWKTASITSALRGPPGALRDVAINPTRGSVVLRQISLGVPLVADRCSCSSAHDRGVIGMRAFPVRLPSGARYWTVLDPDLAIVPLADSFLRQVRFGLTSPFPNLSTSRRPDFLD
ncbi:ISAs1 family transposase [Acrocarpospora sp. B8E8]|uniref:ISAs1 family transposase n=1 Tax=Acrocarpospora sp. B8E8 TaxID=3153572 RepID=UPI00325D9C7B